MPAVTEGPLSWQKTGWFLHLAKDWNNTLYNYIYELHLKISLTCTEGNPVQKVLINSVLNRVETSGRELFMLYLCNGKSEVNSCTIFNTFPDK